MGKHKMELINMKKEFDHIPEVYSNGSLLRPTVITYCNTCNDYVEKVVESCQNQYCGSKDVSVIKGDVVSVKEVY
ncbi:hypothetical protein NUG13_12310 [Bacillus subtilis]|nr:hypothetical protein [Bacillus subtilis]MCR4362113.1 hypothetical protein [Bacillus subtilis]